MHLFKHKKTLQAYLSDIAQHTKKIGFVPTMGALHQGHLSMVKRALRENDFVVVSIFVNPTQFDYKEDLEKYPNTLEEDTRKLLEISPEIIVFAPHANDIYDDKIEASFFDFGGLENSMEGQYRSGHFQGVATIVKKLLEVVQPYTAYFGEKDFQQLLIVKKLVNHEKLPLRIVACPTAREASGLAMSSRNERLSPEMRIEASFLYKTLVNAKEKFSQKSPQEIKKWVIGQFEKATAFSLQYVEIADAQTLQPIIRKRKNRKYRIFIAAYINKVRLIDNIALN